jgi:hypothetical protein
MVVALKAVGLGPLAAGVVSSDYFPNQAPQQPADKRDVCKEAKPQIHSHFFTANGMFGSVGARRAGGRPFGGGFRARSGVRDRRLSSLFSATAAALKGTDLAELRRL